MHGRCTNPTHPDSGKQDGSRQALTLVRKGANPVSIPDGAEANVDAIPAEVERREALPPLVLTIQYLNGSNEETTVARWEMFGASPPSMGLNYDWGVGRVLFGGIELRLTDRWEEGAADIEDGVSAGAVSMTSLSLT